MGDDGVARTHGHEGGQHGAGIGDHNRHPQQPGGVAAQLGDGGGDEADDNQRNAEVDNLAQDVFGGADKVNHGPGEGEGALLRDEHSQHSPRDHTDEQAGRQAFGQFFHTGAPFFFTHRGLKTQSIIA